MRCGHCQTDNPPGAKFCVECAAPLAAAQCGRCRGPLPLGAKFCPECAHPTAAPPAGEARFASPVEYTPKHIADKILDSRGALEGERKHVSVLFADLKGSMELLADRDPEDARRLLDAVLERMIEAVHHYEGTVNQVMGDGIMALFGAPIAHEDHAIRAAYAALRMQQSVKEYAEELHRSLGIPVHIRVGLNSGEVVVRSIGSDLHMDYTAVGQTTHLAARLEQMAMPGTILAPADALALIEGYVLTRGLGPRPVKGLDTPLEVYEIVGASPIRSRLHAAAARGLTRFVGRAPELHQLTLARDRARAGSGQLVAVVGDPGVGKSRLYWEFTHAYLADGWLLLESTSVSYGRATPYLPVIDLLRAYFKVGEHDDVRVVREKVTGKLLTLDEKLRGALPAILSLLGVTVSDPVWDALGAVERRQSILDAVKYLVLRESQVQPVALLFEDLHWIDSETQALLDSLVESLPTARALLLVNYRPEYQHAWGGKSYYTQLRIDPLAAESATALLDGLLGPGRGLEPLKRMLRERTEGNPFFLEESVRALVEAGVITGDRGAFRLAKPLDAIQVPATVQAVLAARIDRLPPAVKHLLQSAAVIGKTVPLLLLARVAETTGLDLRPGLAQLQSAEFLYETTLFPELEYTFKHALTLEVAYQSLLRERRRVLHAAVFAALEMRGGAHAPESIELLAHHAVRGEVWAPAASYLYRAGAKAQAEARYGPAVAFYEACLDALERLGPAADRTLQLDAYLDLWSTRISTGRIEGLGALGERVEALARALDDGPRLAQVQVRQAQAVALAAAIPGTLSDAVGRSREAATRADASDLRTRSYAHFIAGLACRDMGRYTEALDEFNIGGRLFESNNSGHEPGLVYPILVSLCAWRSEAEAALGRFDAALASANEALRVAGEIRHPSSLVIANAFLGYVNIVRGNLPAATSTLERGLAIAEEHDLPHGICANGVYLAWVSFLSNQHERGLDCLERGLERHAPVALQWTRYGSVTATAYLEAGRPDHARRVIAEGLTTARERGAQGYVGPLLRLEADVLLVEGEVERAGVKAQEAFAIAGELGAQPEIARCHETLWRIAASSRDPRRTEHATAARRIFEDLGMTYWAARVTD
jgi:class 3 adenylate cyclase/tetratricopeptide (TPR) repeat protein